MAFSLCRRLAASGSVSGRSAQFQPTTLRPQAGPRFLPGSLRPPHRCSERVATSSPSLSALVTLTGAHAVLRDFPQVSAGATLVAPVVGRFLSDPSGLKPCGLKPAVRNPKPSPRASSCFQDLSEPAFGFSPGRESGQEFYLLCFQYFRIFLHRRAAGCFFSERAEAGEALQKP